MQASIVHKMRITAGANEIINSERLGCIICSNHYDVHNPTYFGKYVYMINLRDLDKFRTGMAPICEACHWKIESTSPTDIVANDNICDDSCTCERIIQRISQLTWSLCVDPDCGNCYNDQ